MRHRAILESSITKQTGRAMFEELKRFSEMTPGAGIAALGLGACLVIREANVLSASTNVPAEQDASVFFLALVISMAIMAFIYGRFPTLRLYRSPTAAVIIALTVSASAFISFGSFIQVDGVNIPIALNCIYQVGANIILLMWGEMLFPFGVKRTAYTLALSSLVAGVITVLLAALRTEIEHGAIAMLPVLSIICLYYFNEYNSSRSGFATSRSDEALDIRMHSPLSSRPFESQASASVFVVTMLATLFFFRFSVGKASFAWIHLLGGSGASIASQVANAAGMLLACVLILAFVRLFWKSHSLGTYMMLVFVILALTLYLATAVSDEHYMLYVALISCEQKLILLPVLAAPFIFPLAQKRSPFIMEAVSLALCSLGSFTYAATSLCVSTDVSSILVGASLLLFLIGAFVLMYYDRQTPFEDVDAEPDGQQTADQPVQDAQKDAGDLADDKRTAIARIARDFQLTKREQDILALLAERYTASEIAEALVVTVATAKTHMRNIYAKLDIHSQKELIALFKRYEDEAERKR